MKIIAGLDQDYEGRAYAHPGICPATSALPPCVHTAETLVFSAKHEKLYEKIGKIIRVN